MDMWHTCFHTDHMSTMIQVRNVPDALHRKLKARAAEAGTSLSEYIQRELERVVERPTRAEVLARIRSRGPVELAVTAAALVREERDGR